MMMANKPQDLTPAALAGYTGKPCATGGIPDAAPVPGKCEPIPVGEAIEIEAERIEPGTPAGDSETLRAPDRTLTERRAASTALMKPAAGEHLIAYAYPSSPRACSLGRGKSGCHVFETAGAVGAAASLDEALQLAKAQGTAPHRWSIDHPMNAHFLNAGA